MIQLSKIESDEWPSFLDLLTAVLQALGARTSRDLAVTDLKLGFGYPKDEEVPRVEARSVLRGLTKLRPACKVKVWRSYIMEAKVGWLFFDDSLVEIGGVRFED